MHLLNTYYFKSNHAKIKYLLTLYLSQTDISTLIANRPLLKSHLAHCIYNHGPLFFLFNCIRYTIYKVQFTNVSLFKISYLKGIRISAVNDKI